MKRTIITALTGGLVLAFIGFTPVISQASETNPTDVTTCNSSGWHVNADETDRKPTPTAGGLVFSDSDLIHHATTGNLADETFAHGTYQAAPAPDQDSFFSVEVYATGEKYGTLRWNTAHSYWEATSQGQQHQDADPVALADSFPIHLSHTLVSFGIGYTANPPGQVPTTVTSVTFAGQTYDLTCVTASPTPKPTKTTSSPTPAPTSTRTAIPKPSASSTPTPVAGGLPVTGPPIGLMVGGGLFVLAAGVLLVVGTRRKNRFTA